jgi:hypothetical protein
MVNEKTNWENFSRVPNSSASEIAFSFAKLISMFWMAFSSSVFIVLPFVAQCCLRQRYASRVWMVSSDCRRVNTAFFIFRQIAEHSPISPAPAANPHAV